MNPTLRSSLSWFTALLRIGAGGILAVSGYLKAVRPSAEFAATLESYWIFPASLIHPAARVVPWVELWVGLALLVGFATRKAAIVAAGLYASFVVVLAQGIIRKLPLQDCGCFGRGGPHMAPAQALSLDLALLAVCLFVVWEGGRRLSVDQWIEQP